MTENWTEIEASTTSKRTTNPIRSIVDQLKVDPNPEKQMISLALGDPTVFGNFKTSQTAVSEITKNLESYSSNGYPPSVGYETARAAIAKKFSEPTAPLESKDVIIASGCSGAIDLCITALANEGDNILLPRPGFPLYQTLAESKGIECKYYDLIPEKNWEVAIDHLRSLADNRTKCIVVNNPSNPCGSVYSRSHLQSVLKLADSLKIPIIADEIYADMAFKPYDFISLASLSQTVPILSVGGLAKRYLVPGWRVGWILIHDRNNIFSQVRKGLISLSQLILGANSLVQSAIPAILHETPDSFYQNTMNMLKENADLTERMLSKVPGLKVVTPQGAMYIMCGIDIDKFDDSIEDDIKFTEKLVEEESVLALPGQCFKYPSYFRIVFTAPKQKLEEAYQRIASFCERHLK